MDTMPLQEGVDVIETDEHTGEILIVENPEAHLHPYAQAQIAHFLAKVSACGVQKCWLSRTVNIS